MELVQQVLDNAEPRSNNYTRAEELWSNRVLIMLISLVDQSKKYKFVR